MKADDPLLSAEGRLMAEGPGASGGAAEPAAPKAPPRDALLDRVAHASAEAAHVMAAVDAGAEDLRKLLYRLAQTSLTLSQAVAELLRRGARPS